MSDETVHTQRAGAVLTLTLDRPKANALDVPMAESLLAAVVRARLDESIRCLVLTGSGRFFCAGQDVGTLSAAPPEMVYSELARVYNRLILQLRQIEKPVLAGINGAAAGAGLGLALAADLRLAAVGASFVFGFSALGLTADSGVSLLLPALVGLSRASQIALLEEPLDAQQALSLGLVARVFPEDQLAAALADLAARLAAGPTRAFALTKNALHNAVLGDLEACLEREAAAQEAAARTEDAREGVQAFLKRQPPQFRGR